MKKAIEIQEATQAQEARTESRHEPDLYRIKYNLDQARAMLQLYTEDVEEEMQHLQDIQNPLASHLYSRYFEVDYRQMSAAFDLICAAADEMRDF